MAIERQCQGQIERWIPAIGIRPSWAHTLWAHTETMAKDLAMDDGDIQHGSSEP